MGSGEIGKITDKIDKEVEVICVVGASDNCPVETYKTDCPLLKYRGMGKEERLREVGRLSKCDLDKMLGRCFDCVKGVIGE